MTKISEILLDAADLLWDGETGAPSWNARPEFICQAIARALGLRWTRSFDQEKVDAHPATQFLVELGMDLGGAGFLLWNRDLRHEAANMPDRPQTQGTRYAWLQLAAQVAQEEGL